VAARRWVLCGLAPAAQVVSTVEDVFAVIGAVPALLVPTLAADVIVVAVIVAILLVRRWRKRGRRASTAAAPQGLARPARAPARKGKLLPRGVCFRGLQAAQEQP
jgi:hypothetical protein